MMKINMSVNRDKKLILQLLNEPIEGSGGLSDKIDRRKKPSNEGNIK